MASIASKLKSRGYDGANDGVEGAKSKPNAATFIKDVDTDTNDSNQPPKKKASNKKSGLKTYHSQRSGY